VERALDELASGASGDHGTLTGLADDDHTQYALLAGRSLGQTLIGGIDASDDLALQSTSHASRGFVTLNDKLQVGTNDFVDGNANELLVWSVDGSAVNHLQIANNQTNREPSLSAVGGDANIDLGLAAKGTGVISTSSNLQLTAGGTILTTGDGNITLAPHGIGTVVMASTLDMGANAVADVSYLDIAEIAEPATPAADTLRLWVEDVNGHSYFSYKDATGMVRKLVRDSVIPTYNNSGASIPANRAVYATGSFGGVPTIGKAKADNLATMPCIGVTLEAIADAAYGRVMQVGLVEDVDTSSFTVGDVLYVSAGTAGLLVATAPLWPDIRQEIGVILVDDVAAGKVQVIARSMFKVFWITAGSWALRTTIIHSTSLSTVQGP
jgi:hypothetical protein